MSTKIIISDAGDEVEPIYFTKRLRKKEYIVRSISKIKAKSFIKEHHYSKSCSKMFVYCFGLFKKTNSFFDEECVGVTCWLPPTSKAAANTYPEGDFRKVLALSRMAIISDVPKNAASFLLSQSIKLIDRKKYNCLVTYADTYQNHKGTIYKATNWEYVGETAATPIYELNGCIMGRKRGSKNYTHQEMIDQGFKYKGKYKKHKFRMIIK